MQTASTNNDIEHIFNMPVLKKTYPNAVKYDKFNGNILLKEEKMLLEYRDFVEKYSEVIEQIFISKPDEKKKYTIAFQRR